MKFPIVTVTLVSAALIFVVWEQTREQPEPVTASRFADLSANPVERGTVVDWMTGQVSDFCAEATGAAPGSDAHTGCIDGSEAREPACRRAMADRFPGIVASERIFRDLSITLMNCLVPQSRPID
ncbi:hypothetical protein [Marinobacter sp. F4206]|uniref:hypothetical protein n=1 Tax=Marinobacter sp. F4206 TaxID=2861777 RepID=UPI001C6052B3|nr:hypothetical protein [Marinobacter sp. F4206]MBW4934100.1 hypothetical protein [Marinobacter sp. F4206]